MTLLDELLAAPAFTPPVFTPPAGGRQAALLPALRDLTAHHVATCPAYARLLGLFAPGWERAASLEDIPHLPVGLFKSHDLRSVEDGAVASWVTSSGTGGVPSRVAVDAAGAAVQAKALGAVLREALGPRRLPMILVESRAVLRGGGVYSARAAGVLGLMKYGRDHLFLLDEEERVDRDGLAAFLDRHGGGPFALFGFTFMVWSHLVEGLGGAGLDLSNGALVHGGGWKRLLDRAVDPAAFRAALRERFGLARSFDYYGMAEQIGTIHLEDPDEAGVLRCPSFAHVIIRDPVTLAPQPPGRPGVVQVMSLLPRSYPGHSLLTEDLGVLVEGGEAPLFRILGRAPRAEARGCSDVYAGAAP
ncbi:acyl-protein synthetase [Novispirillum sp. DQ9]|uniref:LuxE/PaaK family acyltransferase n=1 Tax=Novispirillum sp. DQ9 TaxID=3398612 RepID=UPI003C7C4955